MERAAKLHLESVAEILRTQHPDRCRSNVWKTINGLIEQFPADEDEIMAEYRKMCEIEGVDFFQTYKEELAKHWSRDLEE